MARLSVDLRIENERVCGVLMTVSGVDLSSALNFHENRVPGGISAVLLGSDLGWLCDLPDRLVQRRMKHTVSPLIVPTFQQRSNVFFGGIRRLNAILDNR